MKDKSIYSQVIVSKTGISIPVFKNGKTVDSRYDPERESLRIYEQIKPETSFVIVAGIASGVLINTIIKNRPGCFVLAVEISDDDIEFLSDLSLIKELKQNRQICFCSIQKLAEKIIQNYIPSFYGSFEVIEQRGWSLENQAYLEQIKLIIQKAIGIVSADFSVQSHFGKLWTFNIFSNIRQIEKCSGLQTQNFPTDKTAAILAAGPTLDTTIQKLLKKRRDYYIIATDTALSVCVSYKLIPDAVISLDGQQVSGTHFIHGETFDLSDTLFLFDLSANEVSVKKAFTDNGKVCFFTSGHPLSNFINSEYNLCLPELFSGSGTVTISAVDFAIKAGFNSIQVFGADFAYSKGKPYTKGTYLDRLYNIKANRLEPSQKSFCRLEYRTELIKLSHGVFTTQILNAYKESFEEYLTGLGIEVKKDEDIYILKNGHNSNNFSKLNKPNADVSGTKIVQEIIKQFEKPNDLLNSIYDLTKSDICLLPLISWLRNNDNIDKKDFKYYYNKAIKICTSLGGN